MDGGWDTGTWDSATWDFVTPIIDIDTHDGGKRQRKKFAEEVEEKARRRRQVVLAFEHISKVALWWPKRYRPHLFGPSNHTQTLTQ